MPQELFRSQARRSHHWLEKEEGQATFYVKFHQDADAEFFPRKRSFKKRMNASLGSDPSLDEKLSETAVPEQEIY